MKLIAGLALLLLPSAPAFAQDIHAGQTLAQTWCAGCHDITPEPKVARDNGPPPFAVIANGKNWTLARLQTFLMKPHGRMPDYSLTRQEIRDVSGYIMSLKK